jgi:hypothetical protein
VSVPVCGGAVVSVGVLGEDAVPPAGVLGEDWVAAAVAGIALGNVLGETGAVAGLEGVLTGPEVDSVPRAAAAVEPADGPQAETPKAALASTAPAARNLTLRAFVMNMDSSPFGFLSGSASHSTHRTHAMPPWLASVVATTSSSARI